MFNIRKKTIQDNTSRFFAKCNGLSIEHYQLSNYANVSDHSEKVDLTIIIFMSAMRQSLTIHTALT